MSRPGWRIALVLALGTLAAGCGTQHSQAGGAVSLAPPPSLALSAASSAAAWATVEMGGSAAQYNNFWQLFVRPAGATSWQLVTPPGMASNGGFVLAGPAGRSVTAAFRPSQQITYSPLATTTDAGAHWDTGQVSSGLAGVPDALAARPGGSGLIALVPGGVQLSRPDASGWARLVTLRSLAASAAGRACRPARFTAVAFSPAGEPVVAGACARPGVTGIFARSGGTWRAAGPELPAALAGQRITVLRLSVTGGREVALLAVGSGSASTVLAAYASASSGRWALSPLARTHGSRVLSVSFGPGGAVGLVLSGRRGETLAGPGGTWRPLPTLPAGTQVLVPGAGGAVQALAAHRSVMTVWAGGPAAGWAQDQVIKVPIVYGSSS